MYVCRYTHIFDCVEIVYELLLLLNNTASETFLHKSGALRSVDWIFITGEVGLAVTGRIRSIGQYTLHTSFHTGSIISPKFCHIFFLIPFLEEDCIKNIIIVLDI
jgi:hypothetical protein